MNRTIPLDSVVDLRINTIDDLLNNTDELFCSQNKVFEWCFRLEKRVVERWDKDLSPLRVDLGKFWEVCDPDIVCSERSRLSFMPWNFADILELCLFLFWLGLRFSVFGMFQGWPGVRQRRCRAVVTFRLGNYSNILLRIGSTSIGSSQACHCTYNVFTWKVSSTIELDCLWQLWSLEFRPLCKCVRVLEPTKGWFKSLTGTTLHRFCVLLPIWDETGCSRIHLWL